MYQFWMGTEASLRQLQALEEEVAQLRKASMASGEKQAFMFLDLDDDDDDDRRLGSHLIEKVGSTAILNVGGALVNSHSRWHTFMTGKVTSYEAMVGASQILLEDESVSRVILKVGSGGGMVTGVERASEAIRRLDRQKPVTSYVDTHAMSAGYWIAASAREVVAGVRMAEVGSIGTLLVHMSQKRLAEEIGIDVTIFRAGEFKAIGHPMEELDEKAREYLQADVEKTNTFFLEHISKRRNLMISNKSIWAEGKTFYAEEALSVGLIDRVADLEDLMQRASGAANHQRSYSMQIPAEKLARIEAGARPEDVLSEEELKHYRASIADTGEEASGAGEGDGASTGGGDGNGKEATGNGKGADDGGDGKEAAGKVKGDDTGNETDISKMQREMGRMEAKLEARGEQLEELRGQLEAKESTIKSLMSIGIDAVNKRQLALGKPVSSPSSPEQLVTTFHDLSKEMNERFKVGQQSQSPATGEDAEREASIPLSLKVRQQ